MAIFGLETPHLLVVVGLGLMILEAMLPGGHFVVLGVALLLAGLLGTLVTPLAAPIALAGLTLLFGAAALYVYREFDFYGSGSAGQTSDSASLRGQTGTVVERVTGSEGRIKLGDGGFNPYYQARAVDDEIDVGDEVMVLDPGGGNVLTVASMSAIEEDGIDRELRREAERRATEAAEEVDDTPDDGTTTEGSADEDTPTAGSADEDGSETEREPADREPEHST